MKIFKNMQPPKLIGLGFLIVILMGAILLSLPISSATGEFTNFIDALFTATSATCITGLTTVVTAQHWSVFGQLVIIMLIQVGGLGFMAFVTLIFMIIRRKITLKDRNLIRHSYNIDDRRGIVKFIKYICKFTFGVEAVGAVILSCRFIGEFGPIKGIYYGIFHSVSAFCNAGFDLLGANSLNDYHGDWVLNIVIMGLIVTGGIGFPVVTDILIQLKKRFINKFRLKICIKNLRLHSKVAIFTTVLLIVSGAIFFFVSEYSNDATMGNMSLSDKALASVFQSVTLRTAGFSSVNQGSLTYGSKVISSILMFIGGSPASTAGGAKTVTVAVIVLAVITLIRGNEEVVVFKRTISLSVIRKALSVVLLMLFIAIATVIILSVTEVGCEFEYQGIDLFFEVFSALGTVGVTTGITPYLSAVGKILIIICMYIGRIGPVTMAMILTANAEDAHIRYPEGKVIVG